MNKPNENKTHYLHGRCPTITRYGIENLRSGKDPDMSTCKFCRKKIEKIKMGPSATTLPGQNNVNNVPDNIFTSGDINPLPGPSDDNELMDREDAFGDLVHKLKEIFWDLLYTDGRVRENEVKTKYPGYLNHRAIEQLYEYFDNHEDTVIRSPTRWRGRSITLVGCTMNFRTEMGAIA